MGKQYFYWRGAHTKRGGEKDAPSEHLKLMGEQAKINENGGISWQGLWIYDIEAVLRSSFMILDLDGRELNDSDAWSICRSAIDKLIKQKNGQVAIRPNEVAQYANEGAAEYFRRTPSQYIVKTSLSLKSFPCKQISVDGCKISQIARNSNRYPDPDARHAAIMASPQGQHLKSTSYCTVKITTEGRSEQAALNRALDAINLTRGLWTLIGTWGKSSITFGLKRQKPVGVVHLGPIYQLFHADGRPTNQCSYDLGYTGDRELFKPKDGWNKIESKRRGYFRKIRILPDKRRYQLEQLIRRYAFALDYADPSLAFLQLWALLEYMTDTVGANYDKTVERASWIFHDRKLAKERLNAARLRRNLFVHSAQDKSDNDQALNLLKEVLDQHLINLIWNHFKITDLAEYGRMLDLPYTIEKLKAGKKRYALAIRMRKPPSK